MILASYTIENIITKHPVCFFFQIVNQCPPEIDIACHNSFESSTISGPADKMKEFVGELTKRGIFAKEVPCANIAYHSRYIAHCGKYLVDYYF